jgi:DNA processing protein
VVVEAGEKSGALITADLALEQAREVFAVPGNALSPASKGTNLLIQSGAKMVTRVEDILDELAAQLKAQLTSRLESQVESQASRLKPLPGGAPEVADLPPALVSRPLHYQPGNAVEAQILQCLSAHPQHIDDLSQQLDLPVWQVSSALTLLELQGAIRQSGILEYVINDKP